MVAAGIAFDGAASAQEQAIEADAYFGDVASRELHGIDQVAPRVRAMSDERSLCAS
jgi:hypothetical protein